MGPVHRFTLAPLASKFAKQTCAVLLRNHSNPYRFKLAKQAGGAASSPALSQNSY